MLHLLKKAEQAAKTYVSQECVKRHQIKHKAGLYLKAALVQMLVGVVNKGQEDCTTSLHIHGNQERISRGKEWRDREQRSFILFPFAIGLNSFHII